MCCGLPFTWPLNSLTSVFIFPPWKSFLLMFLPLWILIHIILTGAVSVCVCVCVCVCMCLCAHACMHSVVSYSLWLHGLYPASLLCPWDFPGKNIGVGCHFLLQGISLTQGSNLCLCVCCIAGVFFTTAPPPGSRPPPKSWPSPSPALLSIYKFCLGGFIYSFVFNSVFPVCVCVQSLSRVWLFAIPWTVTRQGSSVHGIFQARILEWVAIFFSRESYWSWDWTWVFYGLLHCQANSLPLHHLGSLPCGWL